MSSQVQILSVTSAFPTLPSIITDSPSNVTTTSATLNGTLVASNGSSTTATFQYGIDTGYGTTVACDQGTFSSSATNLPFTANVTGLTTDTIYHYRAVGTNALGTKNGADRTISTWPTNAYFGDNFNGPSLNLNQRIPDIGGTWGYSSTYQYHIDATTPLKTTGTGRVDFYTQDDFPVSAFFTETPAAGYRMEIDFQIINEHTLAQYEVGIASGSQALADFGYPIFRPVDIYVVKWSGGSWNLICSINSYGISGETWNTSVPFTPTGELQTMRIDVSMTDVTFYLDGSSVANRSFGPTQSLFGTPLIRYAPSYLFMTLWATQMPGSTPITGDVQIDLVKVTPI